MDSLQDIWNNILSVLGQTLTKTALSTWFSDCNPVDIDLEQNNFVIHTPSEFKKNIILTRFSDAIRDALHDLFSVAFTLVILAGEELNVYIDEKNSRTAESNQLPDMAGFTFDNFVVGPSNKFAYAAAIQVSENPGVTYNPLFIYGNSGLGKTHLLKAIGQSVHAAHPAYNIVYIKGDQFTNDMVTSIREGTQEEFRQKYRKADLLLMDDIQFIAGKQQTQEEFFHTFNELHEANRQIVVTSDRPPLEMSRLEDRIRTRLESGLMADVQAPDVETRMAIIRAKSLRLGMVLSDDVVEFIAENITDNIRQLEGVINRLTAYRNIMNDVINVDTVRKAIHDVIRTGTFVPTPGIIISETSRFYGISEEAIRGQSRQKNTASARQVAMYLCRTLTNMSLVDIGKEFENRNHATVLSSIRRIEDQMGENPEMVSTIRDITSNINSRN